MATGRSVEIFFGAQSVEEDTARPCLAFVFLREVGRIDEELAWRHLKAAGTSMTK
jgi:hypothetical protein